MFCNLSIFYTEEIIKGRMHSAFKMEDVKTYFITEEVVIGMGKYIVSVLKYTYCIHVSRASRKGL